MITQEGMSIAEAMAEALEVVRSGGGPQFITRHSAGRYGYCSADRPEATYKCLQLTDLVCVVGPPSMVPNGKFR